MTEAGLARQRAANLILSTMNYGEWYDPQALKAQVPDEFQNDDLVLVLSRLVEQCDVRKSPDGTRMEWSPKAKSSAEVLDMVNLGGSFDAAGLLQMLSRGIKNDTQGEMRRVQSGQAPPQELCAHEP